MNQNSEDKGAIILMPIRNNEINMENDVKVLLEDAKPKKKTLAPKRSSIEKAVDLSLSICDKMEVDENETPKEKVISKLIPLLEKEKSKHEDLYLLFRVYDKLKEEQTVNDNSLKNDIDIYKTDFLELKSFLQKKRKPKLSATDLINEALKEERLNASSAGVVPLITSETIQQDKPIKSKETKPKKIKARKDKKPKEENPSTPHQSIHSFEDINCPCESLSNEKGLKPSVDKKSGNTDKEKQDSDKKKTVDKNNRSIMNFFQPKTKELISNRKESLNSNKSSAICDPFKTETKNNQFPLIYNNNIISYDTSILPIVASDQIKSYYSIKSQDINQANLKQYFLSITPFFASMKQHKNIQPKKNSNHLKIIYIHDSFTQNKDIPEKTSMKIKAKNPFIKDEYIIDYDKDSEEEFMEDNAEDIQSNNNSSDDNEEDEEQDNNNEQWIVSDGHFSEDEISEKDVLQERALFEKFRPKMGSIMELLEIRKNFSKPIVIDFTNDKLQELNTNRLCEKLSMKIFQGEDINIKKTNQNSLVLNDNNATSASSTISFPIRIESKKTKTNGINNSIKNHFTDIICHIHGSFETKEQLIIQLNEAHKDISKKGLNTFFKEKCLKLKHNINGKKYWLVKHEILNELNLNQNDIVKLLENHLNEFNEKEKLRLEEREINRQKNQIKQINSNASVGITTVNVDKNEDVVMKDCTIDYKISDGSNNTKVKEGTIVKKRKPKIKKGEISVVKTNNIDNDNKIENSEMILKEENNLLCNGTKKQKAKPKEKKQNENKGLSSGKKDNKTINELFFNQLDS